MFVTDITNKIFDAKSFLFYSIYCSKFIISVSLYYIIELKKTQITDLFYYKRISFDKQS